MTFDMFESASLDNASFDLKGRMSALRNGFKNSLEPKFDAYMDMPDSVDMNLAHWIEMDSIDRAANISALRSSFMDSVKQMYNGMDLGDGKTALGLKEISDWKVHPDYVTQNVKQHAGYAAEVIGTTKENMIAKLNGSDISTFRADDRPDLFRRNDQYVDKIRVDGNGEIVDRIQVKFVGKDADACLKKLTSSKYDKYFNDGMINKMEVPKDFYDEIKRALPEKRAGLEEQPAKPKTIRQIEIRTAINLRIASLLFDHFLYIVEILINLTFITDISRLVILPADGLISHILLFCDVTGEIMRIFVSNAVTQVLHTLCGRISKVHRDNTGIGIADII